MNGVSIGNALTLKDGVAAELGDLLKSGENLITAKTTGKSGFAFILEYGIGVDTTTFTTSSDWKVSIDEGSSWVACLLYTSPSPRD